MQFVRRTIYHYVYWHNINKFMFILKPYAVRWALYCVPNKGQRGNLSFESLPVHKIMHPVHWEYENDHIKNFLYEKYSWGLFQFRS